MRDHRKENRMESFFLSETTKYLYLLFDPDNFLNNNGASGTIIQTPNGECVIDAGGYIFNTEAHPVDPSALHCCHNVPRQNYLADFDQTKFLGESVQFSMTTDDDDDPFVMVAEVLEEENLDAEIMRVSNMTSFDIDKLLKSEEAKRDLLKLLQQLKIRNERDMQDEETNATRSTNATEADDLISRVEVSDDDVVADGARKPVENATSATPADAAKSKHEATHSKPQQIFGIGEVTELPMTDTTTTESTTTTTTANTASGEPTNEFIGNKIIPRTEKASLPFFAPYEKRAPFDPQTFLERIRTLYNDTSVVRDYELMQCKTQPFTQRLAVFGEVIND